MNWPEAKSSKQGQATSNASTVDLEEVKQHRIQLAQAAFRLYKSNKVHKQYNKTTPKTDESKIYHKILMIGKHLQHVKNIVHAATADVRLQNIEQDIVVLARSEELPS